MKKQYEIEGSMILVVLMVVVLSWVWLYLEGHEAGQEVGKSEAVQVLRSRDKLGKSIDKRAWLPHEWDIIVEYEGE